MNLLCWILRAVSLKPGTPRYNSTSGSLSAKEDNKLGQLEFMYPDFSQDIQGKTIIDYGCGEGFQSVELARKGASQVVGIDTFEPHVANARRKAQDLGFSEERLKFDNKVDPCYFRQFDIVISHNSMEHFADPKEIMKTFKNLIKPGGRIYITFGPLWYSMYGAHTNFFCLFPWIHLIFPESVVMQVRSNFTDDRAKRYEEVRGGLNKMTRKKFLQLVKTTEMEIVYLKENYIAGANWLCHFPLLRELCLYHISVVLRLHT